MASRLAFLADRARPTGGKVAFANRVLGFANPVLRLPGFPMLWISTAAAWVLTTVTGAFNTGQIPLGPRSIFWMLMLGWNLVKWQTWVAFTVRKPADWTRAAFAGAVLLNLTLPLETVIGMRAVGIHASTDAVGSWLYALIISLALFAVIWTAKNRMGLRRRGAALSGAAALPPDGLLARAGVAPEALALIRAEDHYCRVHRGDGSSALVHYRFTDALAEVAGLDGAQVHRGTWVAAAAFRGAVRERRRWRLLLADGSSVPVSPSRVSEVRSRGWLKRIPSTAFAPPPQSAVALGAPRP
jgi:hypothetical protein